MTQKLYDAPQSGAAMMRIGDVCPACHVSTDLVDWPMYNTEGSKLCRSCGGISVPSFAKREVEALERIAVALERIVEGS